MVINFMRLTESLFHGGVRVNRRQRPVVDAVPSNVLFFHDSVESIAYVLHRRQQFHCSDPTRHTNPNNVRLLAGGRCLHTTVVVQLSK